MEYLVTMTTHAPDETPERIVDDIRAREAACSRELAAAGHLLRLWRPPLRPGEWRSLGLFAAADGGQLVHHPTPVADIQLVMYDDFQLGVTDGGRQLRRGRARGLARQRRYQRPRALRHARVAAGPARASG